MHQLDKRRLTCGAVIFNPEKKVLIGHKRKYNAWEFSGGRVDPNEKIEDAVHRELFEETGIQTDLQLVQVFDTKRCISFMYTGVTTALPELKEPDKHYAWHYVGIPTLLDMLNAGGMTKFTTKICFQSVVSSLTLLGNQGILNLKGKISV